MRIFLILKERWSKESSLPFNGAYLKMTLLSDRVFSFLKDIQTYQVNIQIAHLLWYSKVVWLLFEI